MEWALINMSGVIYAQQSYNRNACFVQLTASDMRENNIDS